MVAALTMFVLTVFGGTGAAQQGQDTGESYPVGSTEGKNPESDAGDVDGDPSSSDARAPSVRGNAGKPDAQEAELQAESTDTPDIDLGDGKVKAGQFVVYYDSKENYEADANASEALGDLDFADARVFADKNIKEKAKSDKEGAVKDHNVKKDKLKSRKGVKQVTDSAVYKLEQTAVPNDTYANTTEQLTTLSNSTLAGSRTYQAFDLANSQGNGARIAFLEVSTFDCGHPDIDAYYPGTTHYKFVEWWDYADGNGTICGTDSHGTAVATVGAAFTGNSKGIASVAPQADIVYYKLGDNNGNITSPVLAQAIRDATNTGAAAINMSFKSIDGRWLSDTALQSAINDAIYYGSLPIASTGNDTVNGGQDCSQTSVVCAPAEMPNVMGVGAVRPDGGWSSYSNWGYGVVDMVAFGGQLPEETNAIMVRGAAYDNTYGRWAGTSFSAPIVSGVVATIAARKPTNTAEQNRTAIQATAYDMPSTGYDNTYGWGIVRHRSALLY